MPALPRGTNREHSLQIRPGTSFTSLVHPALEQARMPAPPGSFGFFLQPFYYFQVSKKTEPHQPTRVLVWATYEQDVAQIASRLPENARKYALAPWHCDLTARRCIHDALVEQVIIVEKGSGDPGQPRSLDIAIRLLGAHRDRHITMKFPS